MRNRWMLHLKPIVALLLSIAMIASFSGCGNTSKGTQSENETEFQAYYEPLTSDDIKTEGDVYYASSQVLLTSVNDATYEDVEKLIKNNGGEIIGYISATGDYQIRFNDSKTFEELEQLIENLKNDALIEDASLAYAAQFSSETIDYTNDPWIDVNDPSDTSGSVWDEDNPDGNNWWAEAIDMPTVWSMDLSTQTVKVGIIDSMFDITNEDLDENCFAKTWNNPTNDDGTCRVTQIYNDAVAAYAQAVSNQDQRAIERASEGIKNASHGTHVAGIIAAQADNGFGIAGVNQNVKLYGYSVLSDESTVSDEGQWGSIFQYKCAIAHLLNEGVRVINISMGYNDALMGTQDGDSYWSTFTSVNSKSLESFLLKYIEAGNEFLIVKSAGNNSSDDKKYDARNDIFGAISNEQVAQRIIIVGAATNKPKYGYFSIAGLSNTGSRVDVYAPGVDILSDIPSNVTALKSGTSMSAPVVTGLASLIWGINPNLSAEQVRSFIIVSTSATIFNLDDESFLIRDLINWDSDPTAIVNAEICVKLAQATIGNGNNSDAEYGTVSGMVYAITSDGSDFADIDIETLSLHNENGALVSTVPLQDIAYRITDDNTGDVSILTLHTYSMLVEPGTYTLKAEADGYDAQSQQITVFPNDVVSVNFEFTASAPLYSGEKTDVINAINGLLIGVRYYPEYYGSDVGRWTDDAICDVISGKLMWDPYSYSESSFLKNIGLEYWTKEDCYWHFDLELIQKITRDTLGRDFPSNTQSECIFISGNELLIMPAIGESTSLSVQDYFKEGDRIIAIGTAIHNYNAYSVFQGYFQAELEENPSSTYGYTLISLSRIEGNQNFDKITASASSELMETSITHYANRAIDGNLDTAWVEGVRGVGINEWIKLETTDGSKMTVSAIEFSLGYQKNKQLLQNNGWPNKVLIECESGYTQEKEFYTCYNSDVVVLDQPQTTGWIKVTILEATSGAKYDDICISEIRMYGIDPNGEIVIDPSGGTVADVPDDSGSLSTELGLSADSAHAIVDIYVPFCQSLSDTYISSDGSVAKQRSCLVVEFESGSPNLIVHYWVPNAYDPGQFCEAWTIYGIASGKVVKLYSDENYAPTRREIDMVYDDAYGFALREEQTGGYYELIIHYPENVTDTAMYENYNYIQLSKDSHTLRVWTISGDYVDIRF